MTEQWRPVVGYEGLYEVSDQGRVLSLGRVVVRKNGSPMEIEPRILKPSVIDSSLVVSLHANGVPFRARVARLVAESFLDTPLDEDWYVRIKDGNCANCHVDNLEVTAKKRAPDRYVMLSNREIDAIRDMYDRGESKHHIAFIFGINSTRVMAVINRSGKYRL
jgi:hypothetical protein